MPVRIYDIAKKLGIESKQVLAVAKELGIKEAKVPSSSLDKITAEFLEEKLGPLKPATPAPVIERLAKTEASSEKAIETLYLTALARRPTAPEKELMTQYIAGRPTPADGYSGVLWVLLNSGEFVLNR